MANNYCFIFFNLEIILSIFSLSLSNEVVASSNIRISGFLYNVLANDILCS